MPVIINPESEYFKEQMKWEQHDRHGTNGEVYKAGNPYVFRPYPRMLYKAKVWTNGQATCHAPIPTPYGHLTPDHYTQAMLHAEQFTESCQKTVRDEAEHRLAKGQGWCDSAAEAVEQYHREQTELSTLAANAAFQAARMSEAAQREFAAAQDATSDHVADVPAPKKRGRPAKQITE